MKKWEKTSSPNFNYFYKISSKAEKDIRKIVKLQETVIEKLENYLQVINSAKINLYLYPSLTLKKREFGGESRGSARLKGRKIAYVYNQQFAKVASAHEETHILCFEWGKPTSFIENQKIISTASFYEGLAMYTQSRFFNKYFYRHSLTAKPAKGMTLNQAIKKDIVENTAPPIKDIIMYKGYCQKLKNGAQLGSIVSFLIDTYELDKFKELFVSLSENKTLKENEKVFQCVYGLTLNELDKKWRNYVVATSEVEVTIHER